MQRVRLKDGRRRRITDREAARLQSFPDWFEFAGNETNKYNQIGNAVPPLLAYKLAKQIQITYHSEQKDTQEILNNLVPDSLFEYADLSQIINTKENRAIGFRFIRHL